MKIHKLIAAAALLLLAGCGTAEKEDVPNKIGIPIYVEILELNPMRVTDHGTSQILAMLYEGLMTHNEQGDLDYGVAQSFEIDKSGTRYLFKLRDCKWSNGDPVTAYDFEYAWITSLNPQRPSKSGRSLYTIKNAREYVQGNATRNEVGIKVIDEKTLQITLERPSPYFVEQLTTIPYMPLYKKRVESVPDWSVNIGKEYVSNGPFIVDSFQRTVGIQVVKNPLYWDVEAVKLDHIEVAYVPDNLTQAYLFKNGKIDWIGMPFTAFDYEAFESLSHTNKVQHKEVLGAFWVQVNTTNPVLANKNIRKALAYGVNREEIAQYIMRKNVVPAYRFLPKGFYVEQRSIIADDVALARVYYQKGLKELGINKKDLKPLVLSYVPLGPNKIIAEILQSQLQSNLGCPVDLQQTEWKVHLDNVSSGNYDLAQIAWFASYRDPMYFFKMFTRKESKANYSRWDNVKYKELLAKVENGGDGQDRMRGFEELESVVMDELPIIPIYFSCNPYITSRDLTGVQVSDLGLTSFKYATKKRTVQ